MLFGNGFAFWNTIPIRRRTSTGSTSAIIEIDAVVENLAFDPRTPDEIVHPVDAAQHGALAASGWADQGRDTIARDRERDVGDGVEIAVKDIRGPGYRLLLAYPWRPREQNDRRTLGLVSDHRTS